MIINSKILDKSSQNMAEKIIRRLYDQDKFSQWVGITIESIKPGEIILKMKVRPEMVNGFGLLHGGISFAMADTALAFAANSHGRMAVSIEAVINYPAPAHTGDTLTAVCTELNLTNNTGVYDVIINNQTGRKIAIFRGTIYRTKKEHPELKDNGE